VDAWCNIEICFVNQQKQIPMKPNMGTADKIIRILLAAVFAILYFTNVITGTLGIVLLVLGAVFVLTSAISFCPLYAPFKISTRKKEQR
jgi:hypothetical protein